MPLEQHSQEGHQFPLEPQFSLLWTQYVGMVPFGLSTQVHVSIIFTEENLT